MRYLRRVEGLTRMDQVWNEEIRRKRLNQEAVLKTMTRRQRMWKGKVSTWMRTD